MSIYSDWRESRLREIGATVTSPYPRAIFVYGPPSVVTQEIIEDALPEGFHVRHIDCVFNHTDRHLYSAILGERLTADPSLLVSRLGGKPYPPTVFLFSRAERLVSSAFSSSALHTILSLPSLVEDKMFRVVLLSRLSWDAFRFNLNLSIPEPLEVFLPPWTEDEIVESLCSSMDFAGTEHAETAETLYPGYVKAVVGVMYKTTTDIRELSAVCNKLFPDYLQEVREKNHIAAFNLIQHRLAAELHSLYRRRLRLRDIQGNNGNADTSVSLPQASNAGRADEAYESSLSTVARTMLIAAFLASRNPPQHDMRFFSSSRTGRSRSSKAKRNEVQDRAFVLERLLAIFASIAPNVFASERGADSPESVSAVISTSLLVQVSTLVTLGFLSCETGADLLSEPKYRCNIARDEALKMANSLNIGLDQYLYVE
ncbi:Origin recognition complex subunit 5 [Gracilariopsis chorda]|uniref:Origin recognition complex subunit 5 n=1 Tax=Gracilariopsis chorda TaxID=448386 RepID=A0A2V3ISQ7_9FLOR|nr:Origin recognition complex subunit 5 [Gracilariopsis chorda]|eukprot:PXF44140.1 Origin recognition complex subunit 5 [Gracilariopsis chorda]